MKVSKLEGERLDYWVSQAEGMQWIKPRHGSCCTCQVCGHDHDNCQCGYCENWEMAGPIIEREKIELQYWDTGRTKKTGEPWQSHEYSDDYEDYYGATPLIAAMRAYVASKYGNEVKD